MNEKMLDSWICEPHVSLLYGIIINKPYFIFLKPNFGVGLYLKVNKPFIIGDVGAKGDWDFRISDLVKNPDGTDI